MAALRCRLYLRFRAMLPETLLLPVLLSKLVNRFKKVNSVAKVSPPLADPVMLFFRQLLLQRLLVLVLLAFDVVLDYAVSKRSGSFKNLIEPILPASSISLLCLCLPEVLLGPGRLLQVGDLVLRDPLDGP